MPSLFNISEPAGDKIGKMTVQKHFIDKCLIDLSPDVQPNYTEVIVIGNGPSALNLSFILSGYRPFYEGSILKNTNELLHYKLSQHPQLNILQQDLTFLSEGLEGQVNNPMALLFDKLTSPGADLGTFSQSALKWKRTNETAAIPHVVLGKGKVGGTWQTMDRSMKTLSEAFLLQMPSMSIQQWLCKYRRNLEDESEKLNKQTNISNKKETKSNKETLKDSIKYDNFPNNKSNNNYSDGGNGDDEDSEIQGRATVEEMCAYFEEFVESKGLSQYFKNENYVVGVRKVTSSRRGRDGGRSRCNGIEGDGVCGRVGKGKFVRENDTNVDVNFERIDSFDGGFESNKVENDNDSGGGSEAGEGGGDDEGGGDGKIRGEEGVKIMRKQRGDHLHSDQHSNSSNEYIVSDEYLSDNTAYGRHDNSAIDQDDKACVESFGSTRDSCFSSVDNDNDAKDDDIYVDDDDYVSDGEVDKVTMWEVYGTNASGEQFCYRAPRIVLATGSSDQPNRLGVRGEGLAGIVHSQAEFHQQVKKATRKSCWGCRMGKKLSRRFFRISENPPVSPYFQHPVVIVGSGLSAADAVLYSLERKIPVIHVFEKSVEDISRIYTSLSPILYPEYANVFDLMTQKALRPGLYQSFPGVQILAFLDHKQILIQECDRDTSTTIRASLVTILIGSSPNLSFLPDPLLSTLFTPPDHGSHKQLVSVDPTSYQSHHHSGLYAMGPLVGENYVRFLGGGAFAISSHIIKNVESVT